MFFENKKSYNGGSEWQNDYQNMPDYYQTYYRNYDPELGRFVGIDPKAETAESITTYQYAGNNPVMMNDPMGDLLQKLQPAPPTIQAPDWNAISQLQGNPLYNIGEAGPGGGPGGIFGAAYIGRSSDPNWASDGAFDTEGDPFSTDKGAAGRAFWAPAEASGGALDNATNPGWNISIYNAADNVAFNPVDVFTYNGKGIADLTFYGNVYSGYSISTGQGDHGLLINDGHDYNTAQLFSILENQAIWPPGLSVTDISDANQGGEGLLSWADHVNDVVGLVGERLDNTKIGIGTGIVTVALSSYDVGKGYKEDGNKVGPKTYSALHKAEGAVIGGYIGSRVGAVAGGVAFGALVGGLTDGIGTAEGIEFGQWVGGIGGGLLGSWIGGKIGELKDN